MVWLKRFKQPDKTLYEQDKTLYEQDKTLYEQDLMRPYVNCI